MDVRAFRLLVPVQIRLARAGDLPALEWEGIFRGHRELIARAFARQLAGECAMLLAVTHDRPVGQVWIDFVKRANESAPVVVLWALRVIPWLQGFGLGADLVREAERLAVARGFFVAEIGVEIDNPGARRLYERLGYRLHGRAAERWEYLDVAGNVVHALADQWLLRRALLPEAA